MIYVLLNVLSKNVLEIFYSRRQKSNAFPQMGKQFLGDWGASGAEFAEWDSATHSFSKAMRGYCAGVFVCVFMFDSSWERAEVQ